MIPFTSRLVPSDADALSQDAIRATILRMLAVRRRGGSICPSEAARALRADGWRPLMDAVRLAAASLAREHKLVITQRGSRLDPHAPLHGAIRLSLPPAAADGSD